MLVHLKEISRDQARRMVIAGSGAIRGVDPRDQRLVRWAECFGRAVQNRLRYNTVSNVMRDDRLGVLSRPSNPAEWPEYSREDALFDMARSVWCDCVREHNLETM